jgi:hypothetical protein
MPLGMILDLCGGSGSWSQPYRDAGYRVEVVDLRDGADVRFFEPPGFGVHGVLAAPPCTVFASSGARWPRTDGEMAAALALVDACLRIIVVTRPRWWALENPVGKLGRWLGKPRMYFDPFEFGDPYTKRTCIWGEFSVPRPVERTWTEPVEGSRMHRMPPGPERAALRSVTPAGFASAFFEANP